MYLDTDLQSRASIFRIYLEIRMQNLLTRSRFEMLINTSRRYTVSTLLFQRTLCNTDSLRRSRDTRNNSASIKDSRKATAVTHKRNLK